MKDISLRPTKLILSLFEQIQKSDRLPNNDRNSIVKRAIKAALDNQNIDWQFVSTLTVDEDRFEGNVPKHVVLKVEEEPFNRINGQIKETFGMKKITIPYTLKLLLVHYLSSLTQVDLDKAHTQLSLEVHLPMLKSEYAHSLYRNKKRLMDVCRVYLKTQPQLQQDLTQRITQHNLQLNTVHNLSAFFPDGRTATGIPTRTYLAQILAGWFIQQAESQYETALWDGVLDHIIKTLEEQLQIVNASSLEKMRVKKDSETADYYKNIYARMMSR